MLGFNKKIWLSNGFYSVAGTIVAGFFGYLLSFIFSRQLSIAQFGEFQSLSSLFVIVGIFSSGVTYFVIKRTAFFAHNLDYQSNYLFIKQLFVRLKVLSWAILGVLSLFLLGLYYIDFASGLSLILAGLSALFCIVGAIYSGMFVGWQDFRRFALVNVLINLVRLLAPIVVFFYPSVTAATTSLFFSGLGSVVFGYLLSRNKWFSSEKTTSKGVVESSVTPEKASVFSSLVLSFLILVVSNVDILIIRFFSTPEVSGHYSALALLGRIPFFISAAIITVFLPQLCANVNLKDGQSTSSLLRQVNLFLALISGFFIGFYYFFSKLVLSLSFGQKYDIFGRELWLVALLYFFFSNLVLEANWDFAHNKKTTLLTSLVVFPIMVLMVSIFRDNVHNVILLMNGCLVVSFVVTKVRHLFVR